MSELLQALVNDVSRLLLAGGHAAGGDEGLQRRASALRELGQQVTALVPIANAADRVTRSHGAEATAALLSLLVVTLAVRASLTRLLDKGPVLEPLADSGPWTTGTIAADLYPLANGIHNPAWKDREVLVLAAKNGCVADLRLIPVLLSAFQKGSDDVAEYILVQALPSFGPDLVPELWRTLPLHGRKDASWWLLVLCRHHPEAGAHLCLNALQSGNLMLRQAAAGALQQIPLAGRRIVPHIATLLADQGKEGRAIYAEALGSVGEEAQEAVPALRQAVEQDVSVPVRMAAARALAKIRPADAVAALEAALRTEPQGDARRAFTAVLDDLKRRRRRKSR
jgi:hypothetical protein